MGRGVLAWGGRVGSAPAVPWRRSRFELSHEEGWVCIDSGNGVSFGVVELGCVGESGSGPFVLGWGEGFESGQNSFLLPIGDLCFSSKK